MVTAPVRSSARLAHTAAKRVRFAAPQRFERLVAEHQSRVARLCYRLLGWRADIEIEDVVQDVFAAAFEGLRQFRGESSVATWLTRIAINRCRSHMRRRGALLRLLSNVRRRRQAPVWAAADTALVDSEQADRVLRAVRGLPAKYREVIVLRYLEDMSTDQISQATGLTRNAVEVRLNRARQWLRASLTGMLDE